MLVLTMNLMGVVLAVGNLAGMQWTFTPTAQLAVTATLALLTFLTVIVDRLLEERLQVLQAVRAERHAAGHAHLHGPDRADLLHVRPLTLAMRLFGNMLGGHVVMNIFASFVVGLGVFALAGGIATLGFLGSALSLSMVVALTALELVVAVLQAFVFAALATVYLNEVVNLGHGH